MVRTPFLLFFVSAIAVFTASFFVDAVFAAESTEQFDAEAWLEDDSEFRSLDVNEGELTFIEPVTDKVTLHSEKELTFTEAGINTGWAKLKQCYFNISPVPETEIVFRYKQIKNFKITSHRNIGKAVAEGQVVRLNDISADASVCVTADVNVVEKLKQGSYAINSGPYYLQFLDGYYPYHVHDIGPLGVLEGADEHGLILCVYKAYHLVDERFGDLVVQTLGFNEVEQETFSCRRVPL